MYRILRKVSHRETQNAISFMMNTLHRIIINQIKLWEYERFIRYFRFIIEDAEHRDLKKD
ncbi:hypothetical protein ACFL1R_06170 [Candidatus Latescibacterota bacterium]